MLAAMLNFLYLARECRSLEAAFTMGPSPAATALPAVTPRLITEFYSRDNVAPRLPLPHALQAARQQGHRLPTAPGSHGAPQGGAARGRCPMLAPMG